VEGHITSYVMASLTIFFLLFTLATAADLTLTNQKVTMGGSYTYGTVTLVNSVITVPKFNGNYATTGILELRANSFSMDASSTIDARGTGWQTPLCSDGLPLNNSGGSGGCSVRDSGGGGGHIGAGGVGTTDCALPPSNPHCQFPKEFEQTCYGSVNAAKTACVSYTDCRTGTGTPSTAGFPLWHSVYDTQLGMGGSGGDKGCRDGDGFNIVVGGNGGGRVKLIVNGTMSIYGKITTAGYRGCGRDNDSGGGGAGGTVLLVANELNVSNSTTKIEATGGRGGDSQDKTDVECAGTQFGGTCDDCGGGGGGGLIYILAGSGNFRANTNAFNVSGAFGGSCIGCENEAKGVDGWIQYGSEGEECNGYDDTYDGIIDEDQPLLSCGLPSCVNGVIQSCPDGPTNNPSSTVASTRATGRSTTASTNPTTSTASTTDSSTQAPGSTTTTTAVITGTATELNSLSQSQTVIITTNKNTPSSGATSNTAKSGSSSNVASSNPTETNQIGESSGHLLFPATIALAVVTWIAL